MGALTPQSRQLRAKRQDAELRLAALCDEWFRRGDVDRQLAAIARIVERHVRVVPPDVAGLVGLLDAAVMLRAVDEFVRTRQRAMAANLRATAARAEAASLRGKLRAPS